MDFEELCAVTSRNFFDLFKPERRMSIANYSYLSFK